MEDAFRKMPKSKKAHQLIPAGAHTYSRTDEVFPGNAPKVIERSKGVHTWDVDGNEYIDYGMACRSVTIGYDYDRISDAAIRQIRNGNTATKASKIEVEAAEEMCSLFPWVDMVKFAKNGSTVTTAATKLARAYTGRKYIARCKEHSFFSYDDWFIGNTVVDAGIPQESRELTLQFSFNDIGEKDIAASLGLANGSSMAGGNRGLILQIGDTADTFNQIAVSVANMSSLGIGVADVDISKREGAASAIDTIRAAIDKVSEQRAVLGATQNRLEYTINNLDTASENLQSANSRIRDTDMAKMMMEYTKMNVLTQSAQAMLAQANQQPQSVLQLLQ